jgi:hypothetical protein
LPLPSLLLLPLLLLTLPTPILLTLVMRRAICFTGRHPF